MFKILVGFFLGVTITAATAEVWAEVSTNGVFKGYEVQKDGKTVCTDPSGFLNFRSSTSYIICPD